MIRQLFETYVETRLAPTLSHGAVVILDNFLAHKSEKAAQGLKQMSAWFVFLPPTVRISIRLNRPSPRSNHTCAKPKPKPNARCALARHWRHLRSGRAQGMPQLLH